MTTAPADPILPSPQPETGATAEGHYARTPGKVSLWTGVLGGAIVWAIQLQAGYAISRFSHEHPWLTTVHHVISAVSVLAAAACALLAWRDWRRLGGGRPRGTEGGVTGRSRFLAALGVITSGLFAVVILAQWVAVFFLDPAYY